MKQVDWSEAPEGARRPTGRRNFKSPKLTYGHGFNDADYVTQDKSTGLICPFFQAWRNMLRRAYSPVEHARRPSYIGTVVCGDWLRFSTFKAWMEQQDWQGKQLDKDLLVPGNKVYGPDTCCFISRSVNSFLTDSAGTRGRLPIGVSLHKDTGKFVSQIQLCGAGRKHLGLFDDPDLAHRAWLAAKRELAVELARSESDPTIAGALIRRFAVSNYRNPVPKP